MLVSEVNKNKNKIFILRKISSIIKILFYCVLIIFIDQSPYLK
jgi:hypothetical protein